MTSAQVRVPKRWLRSGIREWRIVDHIARHFIGTGSKVHKNVRGAAWALDESHNWLIGIDWHGKTTYTLILRTSGELGTEALQWQLEDVLNGFNPYALSPEEIEEASLVTA